MKQTFRGTDIEIKIYGKADFARALGISSETLRRYMRRIDHKQQQNEGYNPMAKILFPNQIKIILDHYGFTCEV